MPTILKIGQYRFYFYSYDLSEPEHVHVRRERFEAKFWLKPIKVAFNRRFHEHELNQIEKLVQDHKDELLNKWYEYSTNRT